MFFGTSSKSINSKWNINDFVVGSNKSRRRNSDDDRDEYELNNAIKKIEQSFNRGSSDLDSILKEIKNKRKEIRIRVAALNNDPENEAVFQKMEVDLLLSQVKIVESKVKFSADKFKQIRDEKKLNIDKTPKGPDTAVTIQTQNNSPLSNINPSSAKHNILRTGISPTDVRGFESRYDKPESFIEAKTVDTPRETRADGGGVAQPSNEQEPVVISRNWDGAALHTTSEQDMIRKQRVLKRLENEEELFRDMKSSQGIDYSRSIDSIVNKKTKNITKKMFINPNTGTYYVRSYEDDKENGGVKLCTTETFDSIMHIGVPTFNTRNKTVKTQYNEDSIPYVVEEDDNIMPDYYSKNWKDPVLRKYLLKEDILETL